MGKSGNRSYSLQNGALCTCVMSELSSSLPRGGYILTSDSRDEGLGRLMVIKELARALPTDFIYTRLSRTFFRKGFKRFLKKFWDLKTAGQFSEWTRSHEEKPFTFQRLSLHRRFCLHLLNFPKREGTGGHSSWWRWGEA